MARDRLQILRRVNSCFDVLLYDQDLKQLPKERREEMIKDIPLDELHAPAPDSPDEEAQQQQQQ